MTSYFCFPFRFPSTSFSSCDCVAAVSDGYVRKMLELGDSSFKDLGRLKGGCEVCFVSGNAFISTGFGWFFFSIDRLCKKCWEIVTVAYADLSFCLMRPVLMMLLIVQSAAHFYTQASGREQF